MTESNRILVHRIGDPAPRTAPESSSNVSEAHLQEILVASPHWLSGVPEGSFSVRELSTSAGPSDVVIVAPDGALTAVACKLESNIEKRRIVDRIDADLRRLVEYLNRATDDRIAVTALQLSYARHADLEVLVPSNYGGEIAAAKTDALAVANGRTPTAGPTAGRRPAR